MFYLPINGKLIDHSCIAAMSLPTGGASRPYRKALVDYAVNGISAMVAVAFVPGSSASAPGQVAVHAAAMMFFDLPAASKHQFAAAISTGSALCLHEERIKSSEYQVA